MPIFIIIALDIVITLRFLINCSTVICSPVVLFSFKREASSETYSRRVYFPSYIFRSIKPKSQKYLAQFYSLLFLLYLSLSNLILASDREGIDNPFIVLGTSVWLFVQVHILETCLYLLLDWYLGSQPRERSVSTLLHQPFLFKGKTNASSRSSRKNFSCRYSGGSTSSLPSTHHKLSSLALTLFSIFLSFYSPPLLKRFQKNTKIFAFFALLSFVSSFAFCLLVC